MSILDITVPAWMDDARCAGAPTEIFFPEGGGSTSGLSYAQNLCSGCPVRLDCLEYALADSSIEGIWAGTTEAQRKTLRKKNAA